MQEQQLIAVGGQARGDRAFCGVRVWSDQYQQSMSADCEALTWFARHIAEAEHEQQYGHDAAGGNGARDPQYLCDGPGTNKTILVCALQRAREQIRAEQDAAKKGVDT